MSGREKNAHFRAHYLLWPKFFWSQNSVNQEALSKSWFQRKLPKTKNDTFLFKKVFFFFDMGEKVGFTNCVFEKLCFSESTIL